MLETKIKIGKNFRNTQDTPQIFNKLEFFNAAICRYKI